MVGCVTARTPGSNGVARSYSKTHRCIGSPNGADSGSAALTYPPSDGFADLRNTRGARPPRHGLRLDFIGVAGFARPGNRASRRSGNEVGVIKRSHCHRLR
jgi:hypothetical protein